MEDICSKDYAEFLEETLSHMVNLPVEGICIMMKLRGGGLSATYYNSNMMDKFIYAGYIQQNATLDMLRANNLIKDDEEDSPEEKCA